MQTRWEYLTPQDFDTLAREEHVCVLPMGSLERHGEHLPFGADALVAHDIACRAAAQEPCVVFPPYWFGQVHEASCFSGAVNFPTRLLLEMLETLLSQIAHNGFSKIVILSGHGGNADFLHYFAMSQCDNEVPYTLYSYAGGGAHEKALADTLYDTPATHAGEGETSDVMAVVPEGVVHLERQRFAEPIEPTVRLADTLPGVYSGLWWHAMYPENVTNSPSHATKEKGEAMLKAKAQDFAEILHAVKADTIVPTLQKEFYKQVRDVGK